MKKIDILIEIQTLNCRIRNNNKNLYLKDDTIEDIKNLLKREINTQIKYQLENLSNHIKNCILK